MVRAAAKKLVATEMVLNSRFGVSRSHKIQLNRAVAAMQLIVSKRTWRQVRERIFTVLSPLSDGFLNHVTADQTDMGRLIPR